MLILFCCIGIIAVLLGCYPLRHHPRVCVFIAICLLISVSVAYCWFGSMPLYLRQLQIQRIAQTLASKSPEQILKYVQSYVARHPDSAQGWYLLGKLYAKTGQRHAAAAAFRHAYRLHGSD